MTDSMTSITTKKEELISVPCEPESPLHHCRKGAPEAEDSCVRKGPGLPREKEQNRNGAIGTGSFFPGCTGVF